MDNKVQWLDGEVISYLEDKISDERVTDREQLMYEDYIWNGELDLDTYAGTYRRLIKEMRKIHRGY